MRRARGVVAAAIAAALCAGAILPAHADAAFMPLGGVATQPVGHFDYCRRNFAQCRRPAAPAPGVASGPVAFAPEVFRLVARVNRAVNAEIEPASDQEMHGREEYWSLPISHGDCEDYALLKRQRLIEAGLPAGSLLMTVVRKPDGEGHAVLTLATQGGDFILDNLDGRVRKWTDTPYDFLKRQDASNPARWVSIAPQAGVQMASGRDARIVPAALR